MNAERDEALRTLAFRVSETLNDQQFDIALGAVLLWATSQLDMHGTPAADAYTAKKLRQIADVIDGAERPVA